MTPKIKNILIFTGIGLILILVYTFFIKSGPDQAPLLSTSADTTTSSPTDTTSGKNSAIAADFLSLLLNIKNINLEDAIFSDPAFISLKDSSIELIPDGTEGRPNPFAPIGTDIVAIPLLGGGTNSTVIITPASIPVTTGTPPQSTTVPATKKAN